MATDLTTDVRDVTTHCTGRTVTDFNRVSLVYILAVLPGLLPWRSGPGAWFLSMCHLLGALAPWCGSFLYHLFMNHTRGEQLYHRLLQLDMLGIWVSQSIEYLIGKMLMNKFVKRFGELTTFGDLI
ncbi:hypothetical protein SFRURICE_010897 [Spodoptera frugiperda]|nr:hypothetical protein SFRURICE_010897 [Spodoptera frugiperda]